jgi:hypothetical protein
MVGMSFLILFFLFLEEENRPESQTWIRMMDRVVTELLAAAPRLVVEEQMKCCCCCCFVVPVMEERR